MKIRFVPLLTALAVLFLFSCGKHNDTPTTPTPPTPVDSLFSWQLMYNTGSSLGIQDVWFVSPAKGFFVATDNSIYQSQDSGKNWTKIPNSTSTSYLFNLFFVNDTYGFAQGPAQLEVTTDGGATWSQKQLATSNSYNIFFTTPALGYYGDANSGVFRTTDSGNTWKPVYEPAGSGNGYYPFFLNASTGFVFSGNGYFAKSTDSGSTWQPTTQISIPSTNIGFNSLQFIDPLTGYYAGSGGLLKTADGGQTWGPINTLTGPVNVVKFFDANTGYYMADSIIFKTVNGGQVWTPSCKLAKNIFTGMHFISPTVGWASTGAGSILRLNQ